ncbi:DUF6703 family protein [Knoellia koreensis]|uniref:DUF6703 family protein n=1 Tax=Knoellia koreensis TaxID=2730921 RepID=UPI003211EAAE
MISRPNHEVAVAIPRGRPAPVPRGGWPDPYASRVTTRERIESASLPVVKALNGMPRAVPFLIVLALMVGGILLPAPGWLLLVPVVLFLTWTLYLGWPALDMGARMGRITVVLIAIAITLTQAFPR